MAKKIIESTALAEAEAVLVAGGGRRARRDNTARAPELVVHQGVSPKIDELKEVRLAGVAEGRREGAKRIAELETELTQMTTAYETGVTKLVAAETRITELEGQLTTKSDRFEEGVAEGCREGKQLAAETVGKLVELRAEKAHVERELASRISELQLEVNQLRSRPARSFAENLREHFNF